MTAGLRSRLVFCVLVAVVPALGAMAWTVRLEHARLQAHAEADALRATMNAAGEWDEEVARARGILDAFAHTAEARSGGPACDALAGNVIRGQVGIANLSVTSPEGLVTCSALPRQPGVAVADRAWFREALSREGLVQSDFLMGRIAHRPVVTISEAMRERGVTRGVVAVSLDVGALAERSGEELGIPGVDALVVGPDGAVLSRFPASGGATGDARDDALVARVASGGSGVATGRGTDGVERLYGYTPLGARGDATLAVGLPREAAFAEATHNLLRGGLALAGTGLVALATAWAAAELLVVRRVRVLSEATSRLAGGDLSARTELPHGGDELGQLAARFDRLAEVMAERDRLEDQLRQAQKMEAIGKLAGGVAHDFNNLLTAILGYGDVLRVRLGARSPMQRELGEILRAAHRAAALTRQLLAFSRRQALAPRAVAVDELVANLEKMLRRLIGEDIELVIRLGGGDAAVLGDPGQLEQVVMNLAVNARDAMPTGGRLTISTTAVDAAVAAANLLPSGEWVGVVVEDTGVGMDESVRRRVFEPFFTTKATGTGLGLSMVYGIVQQCGGVVRVDSAPGKGAAFRVFLPRTRMPPPIEVDAPAAPPQPGVETVLLVEDDASVRAFARRALEEAGYTVLEAGDPAHAEDLAAVRAPDLLVTDVIMPGRSGRELAASLRARLPALRVLFISGYTDGALANHGMHDALQLLAKPFTPPELLRTVRDVLDRPEGPQVD